MTPTFETVPDHWKHPLGPYRQAPSEFGGLWWLINPFVGEQPWKRKEHTPAPESLPEGFKEIFGERPQSQDFHSAANPSLAFRTAVVIWEQSLDNFKQSGFPSWSREEDWKEAEAAFIYWGLGKPSHYEGRYGWMTRFVDSEITDFESMTWTALNASHLIIAQYQLRLLGEGIVPSQKHPFVPASAWPKESE